MAKILIALSGAENTGKTSTLLSLIEKLEEKFGIQPTTLLIQGKDKVVIFQFNNFFIGINTGGDDAKGIKSALNLMIEKCDVMITAARTKGQTIDAVYEFGKRCQIVKLNKLSVSYQDVVNIDNLNRFEAEQFSQYLQTLITH